MPKSPSTAGLKSPAKQEMEDGMARAMDTVADALEASYSNSSSRRAADKMDHAGPTSLDGECRHGEKFAIYLEVELNRGLAPMLAPADRAVPAYAWIEELIKDHLEREIPDMREIIILSPTACLIFKGRRSAKEGYVKDEVFPILERIQGGRTWAGKDAVLMATAVSVAESRHILSWARTFIRSNRLTKLTSAQRPTQSKPAQALPHPETSARGWGKGKRADKYFAKRLAEESL